MSARRFKKIWALFFYEAVGHNDNATKKISRILIGQYHGSSQFENVLLGCTICMLNMVECARFVKNICTM